MHQLLTFLAGHAFLTAQKLLACLLFLSFIVPLGRMFLALFMGHLHAESLSMFFFFNLFTVPLYF